MRHFLHYRFAFMGLVSVLLLLTSCASSTKTTVSKPKVTISNIGGSYAPICATGTPCTTLGTAPTVHAGSSKPAPTGAITIGDWQTPDTINPFYADEHVDYAIMSAIYGSCVVAGADLKWLPDQCVEVPTLANKDVSADGLTVTMKLLSNLQWSDGQPLTSADYQWTWQTLVDAKTSAFNIGGYAVIDHIDTPDAHTVVVHFKAALGPYLSYLPFALPQHEFGKADHTQLATSAEFNFKPTATSGAYAVSDFALGDHWTLAPNPHYTSMTFYGPFLKSITFQSYPDIASEVKAFSDGKLTVAQNFAPANLDALKGIAPASLKTVGSVGYEHVEYNQSNPILAKPAVRQALTLAVDRCAIVQKVLGQPCATTVATSIVTPAALDFDKTLTAPAADAAKANALLDKAGFTQKGSDGIRLDSAGKPITLTLVTVANDSARASEATLLAADWKAIGIGVTITPTAANLLFADFNHGGILANGQWGIAIFAYVGTADPDFTYPIYHSSGISTKDNPTGTNYAHINEPQIDAALQQERAVIDFDTRVAALKQVQQIVVAQSFDVTPLYVWPVISATSPKLQNALFSPALYATDWNIADWSLAR